MPPENGLRLNHQQVATPAPRPEPPSPNPQDSVLIGQAQREIAAQCHLELVSEEEILEGNVAARSQAG